MLKIEKKENLLKKKEKQKENEKITKFISYDSDTIIDIDNKFNKVFSSFNPLNIEFSSSSYFIDVFSSCFSFHSFIKCKDNYLKGHSHQFNNIVIISSLNYSYMLITSNTSIKNNIAISITHIHICDRLIIKTIKFWECPSYCNWLFFKFIDRNTKCFHQTLLFFYKLSWDFSMKSKYNDII